MPLEKVRVDRWLWSVRAYKTRSLATDACKRNWVSVNGNHAKPSRELRCGDLVTFKLGPLIKEVKVLQLLEKRISAKLVEDYMEDLTPESVYDEAEKNRKSVPSAPFGQRVSKGRPSKKERRELEEFFYNPDGS
ncbi:MAG: RNA-binding S4 domain-containing protein [Opitutales bacterium]|jgi:ribosome-associated heat shock protein Hsp15|nr:RNA-binding S4 domain-containing protein [Opitutales bacterium]